MPRIHGATALGWWSGHANPTTGPTTTTTTWVGNQLKFTVPGRVMGIAFWDGSSTGLGQYSYGVLVPDLPTFPEKGRMGILAMSPGQSAQWQHIWFRPLRVTVGTLYRLAFVYLGGGFFRTNNALTSPVTRNGIQLINGFQNTSLDIGDASLTANANANAVDVLFQAD